VTAFLWNAWYDLIMLYGAGSGRCLCGDSGGAGRRLVREGKKGNIRLIILPSTISTNLPAGSLNSEFGYLIFWPKML